MDDFWTSKVKEGMKLIIEGCTSNPSNFNCKACPFDELCISIWRDKETKFTTPDSWENEGLNLVGLDR